MKPDSVVRGPRAALPSASIDKSALEMASPQAVCSARMEHLKLNQKFDSPSSLNTRNRVFSPNPELITETLWPML